jgi:hypothetical protein
VGFLLFVLRLRLPLRRICYKERILSISLTPEFLRSLRNNWTSPHRSSKIAGWPLAPVSDPKQSFSSKQKSSHSLRVAARWYAATCLFPLQLFQSCSIPKPLRHSGIFLKKMPHFAISERARKLWNRPRAATAPALGGDPLRPPRHRPRHRPEAYTRPKMC